MQKNLFKKIEKKTLKKIINLDHEENLEDGYSKLIKVY